MQPQSKMHPDIKRSWSNTLPGTGSSDHDWWNRSRDFLKPVLIHLLDNQGGSGRPPSALVPLHGSDNRGRPRSQGRATNPCPASVGLQLCLGPSPPARGPRPSPPPGLLRAQPGSSTPAKLSCRPVPPTPPPDPRSARPPARARALRSCTPSARPQATRCKARPHRNHPTHPAPPVARVAAS